ncbi:MAG: bifunctional adenosylcobinamide kinase/adenosylcobinamide-phosphate guanylyltransferase [Pseudomonadota bacterium]
MSDQVDRSCTLILGGARSGKSSYAESVLERSPEPLVYIATAQAFDFEMQERITAHQQRRDARWTTVEAPLDLPNALKEAGQTPVLVDCLTLWLSNLLLGEHDIEAASAQLATALTARTAKTVLVSNEVGMGIVPENALGRAFRDHQGILNQRMAKAADHVVFVAAGLPLVLKGPTP